ncbi:unnamed protein product [Linum trigynum]|uniref:Uncharacterized protein n=1 Tax=Linum trigynum TaxID=586398 RepID=A0AAV2DA21_9ROSI
MKGLTGSTHGVVDNLPTLGNLPQRSSIREDGVHQEHVQDLLVGSKESRPRVPGLEMLSVILLQAYSLKSPMKIHNPSIIRILIVHVSHVDPNV